MTVRFEPLAALGRAHVGFCEQLAWFALESFERAHRLNMDAFEAFWERRIAEARLAAGMTARPIPSGATGAAFVEHWTRMNETASYLCREFGRLTAEYAEDLKNTMPPGSDASAPDAPVRGERAKAAGGAMAKAA